MFYLTKGFLRNASERGTLFNNALTNSPNKNSTIRLRNYEFPVLVRVDDIIFHEEDNLLFLRIFDGESSLEVNLETSKWNLLSIEENKLDKGGVIIIYEYAFEDVKLKKSDNCVDMLKIMECSIVGTTSNKNLNESQMKSNLIQDKNLNDVISFTVSQISIGLNSQNWSFKAKLVKKTPIREFINKLNGNSGKLMRLQLSDSTGVIELVGFNEEVLKIQNCLEDKFYIITNSEVKNVKNINTQTCDETSIQKFELVLNKYTKVDEYEENEKDFKIFINQHDCATDFKPKTLLKLSELSFKKDGDIISTIAIVTFIDECKEIKPKNKSPILIRNFNITDETMESVKVAIWGKQAEDFNFSIGSVLILSKIKISQFNGVSLSVQWETAIMKVEDDWNHIDEANDLRKWWANKEGLSSSLKRKLSIVN